MTVPAPLLHGAGADDAVLVALLIGAFIAAIVALVTDMDDVGTPGF